MTELCWSDVWVLHSTLHCAKEGAAELSNVIAMADFMNHAIVTWEELNGAILRLRARGLFSSAAPLAVTDAALELHLQMGDGWLTSLRYLEGYFLVPAAGAAPFERFLPGQKPFVSQEEYREGIAKYYRRVGMPGLMTSH